MIFARLFGIESYSGSFQKMMTPNSAGVKAMTTAVDLALRQCPALANLEHNIRSISTYIGPPPSLSLSEACTHGTVQWLDLIWSSSCTSTEARIPKWSLTNYLRSDPHYYRWQFSKSLYAAAERGDLVMVEWLFAHFEGCEAPFEVVEAAASGGHLHILRFLWENRSRKLKTDNSNTIRTNQVVQSNDVVIPDNLTCTVQFNDSFDGETWGKTIITKAVENGQLKKCMDNGMTLAWDDRQIAIKFALNIDQHELAEAMLPEGTTIFDYADTCFRPEVIEKMVESGRVQWDEEYATWALSKVAISGNTELMGQLLQLHSPLRENIEMWKEAWSSAFIEACSHGKLDVVKWLTRHSLGFDLCENLKTASKTRNAILSATKGGYIDVMQYLYEQRMFTSIDYETTRYTIRECPLASVEWLMEHFWTYHSGHVACATAETVKCGRLELLDFFQSLCRPSQYEAVGNRRRRTDLPIRWSSDLIGQAARSGQVATLNWLKENRPDECDGDSYTLTVAVMMGYLDAVKWVLANGSVECSNTILCTAAQHGQFEMVKWLYDNHPKSHSTAALGRAIRYGHLRIAYWLHKKYPDYLPPAYSADFFESLTKLDVKSSKALDTLLLLREVYPGGLTWSTLRTLRTCYSKSYYKKSHTGDLVVGWLDDHYPGVTESTDVVGWQY